MFWLLRIRRLFRATGREALMLWYALRNPGTPLMVKLGTILMAFYLFSPIDIVPDIAVLFGLVDDLAVLLLGIPFLVNRLPTHVQVEVAERADRSWLGSRFFRKRNPAR